MYRGKREGGGGNKYLALQRRLNNYSEKKRLKVLEKKEKKVVLPTYMYSIAFAPVGLNEANTIPKEA